MIRPLVKRRLPLILLGPSLLISIVSLILLPISYYWVATVSYVGRSTIGGFGFSGGYVFWQYQSGPGMKDPLTNLSGQWRFSYRRDPFDFKKHWRVSMLPMFDGHSYTWQGRAIYSRDVGLPLWLTACVFGLPPAIAYRRHRKRQRRIREGLCLDCGYDLRGSIDRCPECGATREIDAARSAPTLTQT